LPGIVAVNRILPLICLGLLGAGLALAQPPAVPRQADRPAPQFDQIALTDGGTFKGLIVDERGGQVHFQYLWPRPGVRTLVFDVVFDRGDIAKLEKAPEPGRTEARHVFEALKTAKSREAEAARRLVVERVPWVSGAADSWRYRGPYFELQSNAEEAFVRLVSVRLEEIFAAYVKTIGDRVTSPKRTRILLFRSLAGFQSWQTQHGIKLLNPAVYDARSNTITVGCDLERLAELRDGYRTKHDRELQELAERRVALDQHYQGKPPVSQLKQLRQYRAELLQLNVDNEETFTRLEAAFFATLFHEAFHAYLDTWVYPSAQYAVPRWLNEGLAQLFEHAFVEVGELNPGRMEDRRLADIQENVRRGRALTLREVLAAPPEQFFVRHTREKFEADRQYNAAWSLAHFLTYELHLLAGPKTRLTEYVSKTRPGQEAKAFEELVGMSLDECEKRWRSYVLRLRVDGSTRPR